MFKVYAYSSGTLAKLLSHKHSPVTSVRNKNHFKFFKDYFSNEDINAKTIVEEFDYVSKDYLIDYSFYYSRCFENYDKKCRRLHFFSNVFSKKDFEKIIKGNTETNISFWNNYLGFIVVKPIPVTMIGMTVLKHYKETSGRYFWGKRNFKIHIFGNELDIESLAFQEQDAVVAACATTAIWSMLSKAAPTYYTPLKSPSEITNDAGIIASDGGRLFPNKDGLDILQICQAIYEGGLVTEIKQPNEIVIDNENNSNSYFSHAYLKRLLNAYSEIGIPLILIMNVPDDNNDYGYHAVTISGYKKTRHRSIKPQTETSWSAECIEKFYAHDDQWGPFSRIEFSNEHNLISSWTNFHQDKLPCYAYQLIIPLYHKIRISYDEVEYLVVGIDAILTKVFEGKIRQDFIWDVKLILSEKFKEVIKSAPIVESRKLAELTRSYPKYIWLASCYIENDRIFDFIFDATDVSNAMIGHCMISYSDDSISKYIFKYIKENPKLVYESFHSHPLHALYFNFLLNVFSRK